MGNKSTYSPGIPQGLSIDSPYPQYLFISPKQLPISCPYIHIFSLPSPHRNQHLIFLSIICQQNLLTDFPKIYHFGENGTEHMWAKWRQNVEFIIPVSCTDCSQFDLTLFTHARLYWSEIRLSFLPSFAPSLRLIHSWSLSVRSKRGYNVVKRWPKVVQRRLSGDCDWQNSYIFLIWGLFTVWPQAIHYLTADYPRICPRPG